jgi:putative transposase
VALALIGSLLAPRLCIADAAYDSDGLRQFLLERGSLPVIPNNPTRKRPHPFDRELYRARNRIERTICRLKDFRRIATRYDKLAQNYLAAVHIAAIMAFWL